MGAAPSQQALAAGEAPRSIPIRNLAPPPPPKKNVFLTILKVAGVLAVLGVGGYYGYVWLSGVQEKTNAERRKVEKNSDGGQVGHIANLYEVLDATEPSRGGIRPLRSSHASGPKQRESGVGREIEVSDGSLPGGTQKELPLIPPVWTLDLTAAKIPEGRVNGMLSGTSFVPETARVDAVPTAQVLRFIQGPVAPPARQILVYLRLKPGEKLAGQAFTVSKDTKNPQVTQVAKMWKTDPKYQPTLRAYNSGYTLKLELGQMEDGIIPGKIFLALPDAEQSVVAGQFKIETALADAPFANPQSSAPGTAPPPRAASVSATDRQGIAP
jgi:hypothetical protein